MSDSWEEPAEKTNKKNKTTHNAWEPAIWAAIFGASTITTIDTLTDSTVAPDWMKCVLILTTSALAAGSAYKMCKSAKDVGDVCSGSCISTSLNPVHKFIWK